MKEDGGDILFWDYLPWNQELLLNGGYAIMQSKVIVSVADEY